MSGDYEPPTARTMLFDLDVPEDVIDGILTRHGHELAEKARGLVRHPPDHSCDACHSYRYVADVIDPQCPEVGEHDGEITLNTGLGPLTIPRAVYRIWSLYGWPADAVLTEMILEQQAEAGDG